MCEMIPFPSLPSSFINPHITKSTPKNLTLTSKPLSLIPNCTKNPFNDQVPFKSKFKSHLDLKPPSNKRKGSKLLNLDSQLSEREEEEELVRLKEIDGGKDAKKVSVIKRGKIVAKRSSVLAKQVISVQSALSLGFVSQLWVDTTSWIVSVVEVRPNLLSGEAERFLLKDIRQVGDVVLVDNDSVLDTDLKMVALESLVGYRVVTPGQRNIGKIRGYSFNINSGAVESLELDSFGISIIPSSLVSTYALFVEDVLEVWPDTVVVHEAAASRVQRLTKGLLDTRDTRITFHEDMEYADSEEGSSRSRNSQSKQRNLDGKEFPTKIGTEDHWDLPMDYL